MAYADLYADASIFYDLNNNMTPVVNTTVNPQAAVLDGLTGSAGVAWQYYNEAPPGSGYTHSLKLNGYASAPRSKRLGLGQSQSYINNYGYTSYGETINFWYKVVTTNTPNNIGSAITFMRRENGTTDETFGTQGGANYVDPTSSVGKILWNNQRFVDSTSTVRLHTGSSTLFSFAPDQWYNISLTWINHNLTGILGGTTIERAVYVNGKLVHNSAIPNTQAWNQLDNLEFFLSNTSTQNAQILSSLAAWNKALTRSEIKALAFNNNIITDIQQYNDLVVTTGGAKYYTTFNNPDKNTNTLTYGTEAVNWGPFDDTSTTISVNQESKFGKSWLFSTNGGTLSGEAIIDGGSVAMRTGMQEVVRQGAFSIECWIKIPLKSDNTRKIGVLYPELGSYSGGRVEYSLFGVGDISIPYALVPKLVSGNSYTSTTVSAAGAYPTTTAALGRTQLYTTNSAQLKALYLHLPEGVTDGEWHHYVLAYNSGTTTSDQGGSSPYARLYVDGVLEAYVLTSTTNAMLASVYQYILMGHPSSSITTATDMYIDKWAFYNRRLTLSEVNKHWTTGKAYINQAEGQVKYWDGTEWATSTGQKVWNGTAWVDWTASYWDGNSWITI